MGNDPDTYNNLTSDEETAIAVFLDVNDRLYIEKILDDGDPTPDFLRFCANVEKGLVKRDPRKKPSVDLRDMEIYNRFKVLTDDRKMTWDDACQQIGQEFFGGGDVKSKVEKAVAKWQRAIDSVINDPETWS